MGVASRIAILFILSLSPGAERVLGQQSTCQHCSGYQDTTIQQIRTHCTYPCECGDQMPICPPGVAVTRDGCGCCPICARQLGEECDKTAVCDEGQGIYCHYPFVGATAGICQGMQGFPCTVANTTYRHGETFRVDCRTQCTCQNGTYACSSLCPNENISPRGACEHPRLVDVPDQCCREWMCDSAEAEHPPSCKQEFTSWSDCSAQCGLGFSRRVSNVNGCVLQNETRICQLRPCEAGMLATADHSRHHHIRKGHECKATQRVAGPVRLHFGPCHSKKRYRPKFCGPCADRKFDGCCSPQLSTTISVEFICEVLTEERDAFELLLDLIEPGRDLWWPDDLLAIETVTSAPIPTEVKQPLIFQQTSDNFLAFRNSLGWSENSSEPVKNLQNTRSVNLEASGNSYSEEPTVYHLGRHLATTDYNYQDTTTDHTTAVTPEMTFNLMTSKKRKKKIHKPYTSWLEFRDEEYEMSDTDEYEDNTERKRRSTSQKRLIKKRKRRDVNAVKNEKAKLEMKGRRYYEVQSLSQVFPDENLDHLKFHQATYRPQQNEEDNHRKTDDSFYKLSKALKKSARAKKQNRNIPKRKHKNNTIGHVEHQSGELQGQKIDFLTSNVTSSLEKFSTLSKIERIIRGRTPSANLTRLWWTRGKVSSKAHKARKKRYILNPMVRVPNSIPGSSGGHTVSFNVQWIMKCACDRSCGITTTTPSELGGDGETLLRRVHRTSPP